MGDKKLYYFHNIRCYEEENIWYFNLKDIALEMNITKKEKTIIGNITSTRINTQILNIELKGIIKEKINVSNIEYIYITKKEFNILLKNRAEYRNKFKINDIEYLKMNLLEEPDYIEIENKENLELKTNIEKRLENNLKISKEIFNELFEENIKLKRKIKDLQEIINLKDFQIENKKEEKIIEKENKEVFFSTSEIAKELGISAIKLNRILVENKIIKRCKDYYYVEKEFEDKDYMIEHYFYYTNTKKRKDYRWTNKGKIFIIDFIEKNKLL